MDNPRFRSLFFVILSSLLLVPIFVGAIVVEIENPLEADSFEELILNIVDFLFNLAIPIMALMIIWGGFLFVTATGKEESIRQGKQLILWAIIGFIIILLAKGLIAFLQNIFI